MSTGRVSFLQAFFASALGTALSRVAGLLKNVVVASALGADATSDAFNTAFLIPNTFRRFVADEGLTGALIPALSQAEREGGATAARALANGVFTVLVAVNLVLLLGAWAGADLVVLAFAASWRDEPEKFRLTVELVRWLFPLLGMVSLVSLFEGLLNVRGHFFTSKVAPALISLGSVAGVWWGTAWFPSPAHALSAGVVIGGVAHVAVHLPLLARRWGPLRLTAALRDERLLAVGAEISKVLVIGLLGQLNIVLLRQIGASLPDGAITHYTNATQLVDVAQGIVAVGVGSALLPNVSAAVAAGDREQLQADLVGAIRLAAFVLLPTGLALAVYAEPLTAMVLRRGAYAATDVATTARILEALVPFMLAVAAMNILRKVFFALGDRRTLIAVGALGVLLTGSIGWALAGGWGAVGLGVALSVATVVQLAVYVAVLQWRLGDALGARRLVRPFAEIGIAMVPAAAVFGLGRHAGDWSTGASVTNLLWVSGTVAAAAAGYLGVAQAVGLAEVRRVTSRITGRWRR